MSAKNDKPVVEDVERLVEAQARGLVPPGVPVEQELPQNAELDTRRSKGGAGGHAVTGR